MTKKKDKVSDDAPKPSDGDTGSRKPMENLDELRAEVQQTQTPPGKKRGPYKKKGKVEQPPEPEPVENPFDKEAIASIYGLICNKAASRPGHEHWRLKPNESEMLGATTMAMIDKYLPKLGPWMVEINFGISIALVFGMRFMTSYEIVQLEKRREKEKPSEPANGIA